MTAVISPSRSTISLPAAADWGQELQRAIETNNPNKAISVLSKHPNLGNTPLPNGEMALNYAIRRGCHELVKSMIQNPTIDAESKDRHGLTPVDHALLGRDRNMISMVLGNRIGKSIEAAQNKTWSDQDLQLLDRLTQAVAAERSKNLKSAPSLHAAAGMGNLKEVQRLATPQNLDIGDKDGMTPLHYAVLAGREDVANWLIGQGSRLDLLASNQKSLLHFAAIGGNDRILQTLLQTKKLNPNAADAFGRTALHFAIAAESLIAARSLIQHGADPTIQSYKSWTGWNCLTALDVTLGIAQKQMEKRDPLALTGLQQLLFIGIAAPWISHYCGGVEILDAIGWTAEILSIISLFQNLKSVKAKLAFLAILPVGSLPGFNVLYRGWIAYRVGKGAIEGLAACWRNRFLETYRPIRNAIVHSVIGLNVGKAFVDSVQNTYDAGLKLSQFMEEYGQFMEEWNNWMKDIGAEEFAKLPFEIQLALFWKFWENYQNKHHSEDRDSPPPPPPPPPFGCPKPKPCNGKIGDCILRDDLMPKQCPNHAEFILNLSGKRNKCKAAYRKLSIDFHPDKNPDPRAEKIFVKVAQAAKTMGCCPKC